MEVGNAVDVSGTFKLVKFSYIAYTVNPTQTSLGQKKKKDLCTQEVQEMDLDLSGIPGSRIQMTSSRFSFLLGLAGCTTLFERSRSDIPEVVEKEVHPSHQD